LDKLNIMKPFYEAYGCPERAEQTVAAGSHDLLMPKIIASCEWFSRYFGRKDESCAEPTFTPIPEKQLWCTKNGQVQLSIGGETMRSLNSARAKKILPKRVPPKTKKEMQKQQKNLLRAVKSRIRFEYIAGPLNVKTTGESSAEKFKVEHLVFESETNMPIPSLLFTPNTPRANAPVVIHACEEGKPKTPDSGTLPVFLAAKGFRVLSIDVRDTGEGALCEIPKFPFKDPTSHKNPFFADKKVGTLCAFDPHMWRRELLAMRALALGHTRSGMRSLDIIRAGDFLKERGLLGKGYVAIGEGILGLCALKAAAFDARAVAVIALRTLVSFRMVTDNTYYNQFQYVWTPGVLKDYDIPDLPALVAPRPVAFISAIDQNTKPIDLTDLNRHFSYAQKCYAAAGCPNGLILKQVRGLPSIFKNVVEVLDIVTPGQ
jgi:hypothetical protein